MKSFIPSEKRTVFRINEFKKNGYIKKYNQNAVALSTIEQSASEQFKSFLISLACFHLIENLPLFCTLTGG
ncbi:MAG: hypothetical protein H2069_02305 [Legionella sp.]|nr:hypothetical protein [Legionella sp.]